MLKGTKKMKRFLCILLTAVMVFGGFPGGISRVRAESQEEDLNQASDIFALEQNEPAELSSYPDNVYNVKKDEAFLLVEKNELAMILSHPVTNSQGSTILLMDEFDFGLKKRDEDNNSFIYNPNPANAQTTRKLGDPYFQIEYVQSIGLDLEGTGRKQYIASIGWASASQVIFEYQNAVTGSCSGVTLSVDASEAYATKNWAKDNVLAITAGDYDGNGKDSAIVYICGNGDGAKLYEFYFDNNNSLKYRAIFNFSSVLKDKNYISKTGYEYKPSVSLTTGDFNGDGRDQLAFSAGFCNTSDSKKHGFVNYTCSDLRQFANCVGILDWNGSSFALADVEYLVDQSTSYSLSGSTKTYPLTIMHFGALTAGDVNNDGIDEIVVAGYMSWTKDQDPDDYARAIYNVSGSTETLKSVSYVCDYSDNYWASAVIYRDENTYRRTELTPFEMVKAHQYTFEAFCNNEDWVFAKLCMASAKVNGDNAPELVFISGGVYDFHNQFVPSPKYTPLYLTQNYGMVLPAQTPSSVNYVRNVAVGNFDGNEAGREQFIFTFWQKTKGQDSYSSCAGVIAGIDYEDSYDSSHNPTKLGEAKAYACNDVQNQLINDQILFVDGTAEQGSVIHSILPGSAVLNAVPVALDTDNDGVLARYRQHGYVYTDPEVLAVLQAGPYFAEIAEAGGYEATCETEYAFSNSISNGTSSGDEVGFEVGVAAEANAGPLKVSLEAGYSMNWSHTYEESYTITKETSFKAYSEDVVVISRVPELIYTYDIWDPANGVWIENGMHVRVPLTPCYFALSVDEYNAFVDEYNAIVGVDNPLGLNKIQKGVDLPLDYHGNPGQYWGSWDVAGSGAQKLSAGRYSLSYTSSSITSAYSTESATTDSQETSHGFHFGLTVQVGGDYLCGEAWAGGYTNLDYSHSTGYSETKVNTTSSHGSVVGIRASAVQGLSYSQVTNGYKFEWEFGKWTRQLMRTGDKVPFYGYVLYGAARRTLPPALADRTETVQEGYSAFSIPNLISGLNSDLTVTKVSGDSHITFDRDSNSIQVAAGLTGGTYTAVFMISNGLVSRDTTFKFTLKVTGGTGRWIKNSYGWWYQRPDGTYPKNQWEKIDGKWYHFDAKGYMQTEWLKLSGKWYYLGTNGAMVTGWQKISEKWYYFTAGGVMQTGWLNLNGKYYYMAAGGAMTTGWLKINDVWYFFKTSGVMAAKEWYNGYWFNANGSWTYTYKGSWKQNAKGWWFGDTSGWYAKNCTITINDKSYTFDANGYWVQ